MSQEGVITLLALSDAEESVDDGLGRARAVGEVQLVVPEPSSRESAGLVQLQVSKFQGQNMKCDRLFRQGDLIFQKHDVEVCHATKAEREKQCMEASWLFHNYIDYLGTIL